MFLNKLIFHCLGVSIPLDTGIITILSRKDEGCPLESAAARRGPNP